MEMLSSHGRRRCEESSEQTAQVRKKRGEKEEIVQAGAEIRCIAGAEREGVWRVWRREMGEDRNKEGRGATNATRSSTGTGVVLVS